jgi:hypothetical protein
MKAFGHIRFRFGRWRACTFLSRNLCAPLVPSMALMMALAVPAAAQSPLNDIERVSALQNLLVGYPSGPAAVSPYEPVSQEVLAAQRGSGAAFALPLLPAAQSQPGVVLWDELKPAQTQSVSVQGGEAANQITIQVR